MATASTKPVTRILVGDDVPHICDALAMLLKGAGYRVDVANSPQELLDRALEGVYELILMDMNYARDTTSGQEGLDLLDRLQSWNREVPVIVMTAWSTVELAVQAMQRGARDFVTKPWDNERLIALVASHMERAREQRRASQAARTEREIARDVQRQLLPTASQTWGSLACEFACRPAHDIGGDLYDVLEGNGERGVFVLADVCGKGVGSALMMASLQAMIRAEWDSKLAPQELLQRVNRLFYRSTRPEHYATLFFGVYEENGRRLRYVNCGHPEPVLAQADGSVRRLPPTGTVVGAFADAAYESGTAEIGPGDVLVVFSDGVIEAQVKDGEYGEDRLVSRVVEARPAGAGGVMRRILDDVMPAAGEDQYDDITLMVFAAA